ncbi:D-alanyl-D-alanine carboxypeptidase [Insulibacter thermoxylanivorax]|uniref:serine-type D-Ala-D-Ala carboxypeptidase n=1 Tax=Insulibacter thermoxylanivorax TaxID=2749268 RepID=A0A916QCF3_9BACL|nr:D-alanyl-D-alanine carboxypeptidase family protein [Insulibacter thermoxylanivorax]GFR36823.1 D-alanyl-D-alanine carboxypeptidase [Insulibacter thermoxylanivorax]
MKLRRMGLIVLMWILIMGVVQGGLAVFAGPLETAEASEEENPSSSLWDDSQSDEQSDEERQEAEAFEIQEAEEPAASEPQDKPQDSIEASEEPKVDLAPNAKSAILMDVDTGTILFEKNIHEKVPPASITKIMTMLLVMEALEQKKITLDEMVTASERAASMGGSQIFLEAGEQMSVADLLKGVAMASGNDASVALAEKIAGSEEMFVQMMNKRAQELGMTNTRFMNSNGLPAENHYSTAHDIAIMSRELLRHELITEYTGKYQDYLRTDTENPFWLVNTNKLVRFYAGVDGLKTGYTSEAKFCLAATAKRDNMRVIAVVLGEPNTKTRNAEVAALFDYAFSQYGNLPIFKAGDEIGTFEVAKGEVKRIAITAERPYSVLIRKGEDTEKIRHELVLEPKLEAPIQKGQPIGKIVVYKGEEKLTEFPLESPQDVNKAGWWTLFKRAAGKMFFVNEER